MGPSPPNCLKKVPKRIPKWIPSGILFLTSFESTFFQSFCSEGSSETEIGPFSDTKEIWQKALDLLGVDNKAGNKTIKRLSPNYVQIIESDQVENPFGSTDFLPRKVIAEFISQNKENTIWIKK